MNPLPLLRLLAAIALVPLTLQAADPVISEFMALNANGITDQDGDRSDWIEIHNPNAEPFNMDGWFLTDDVTRKTKWRFPAVTIPANGQILVFASNKNRAVAGQQLHTNFALSGGGEYLALIRPDGLTPSTEYAPFPAQLEDISYGTARAVEGLTLLAAGSPARALVPSDDTLGTTWRALGFDHSTWTAGTLAAGYFGAGANPNRTSEVGLPLVMQNITSTAYIRIPFTVPAGEAITELKLSMDYDDGFAAFIDGTHVASSPTAPAVGTLTFNSVATEVRNPDGPEVYDLTAAAATLTAGDHVLAIHALNRNNTSSDLFILPTLTLQRSTGSAGLTGYFITATPDAANGGNNTLQLPQLVQFSQPPGPYTTPFALELGGATGTQEIRYTMGDSSTSGANMTEPTTNSTLYTAPINISTSKIIRAAIFDPTTGQKGPTITAHYPLLETAGTTLNTSNFTSNMAIVVADTHGRAPVDSGTNTYTTAVFNLFEPVEGVARLNSTPTLQSRAGIRVRGSSSQGFAKKSYGLELWDEKNEDLDQEIEGFGPDSDWILNGPYNYDDTYIHNAFIYEISRRIGRWAPRTRFVEMFTNQNGGKLDYNDYSGVYVLTEKIKSNSVRLDITGIQPNDNTGEALTGGYIFKIDRADGNEVSWKTNTGVPQDDPIVLVEPDPDFDTTQQINYIRNYIQQMDTTLNNERNAGFSTRNYRNFIDVGAWIDHHILNTVAYNVDALRLSAFFFKDRNGKIEAGPIWDFDRALGSDDGRDANPESWANIEYFFSRDWWGRLFRDPEFVQAWIDRYTELRGPGQPFQTSAMHQLADEMGAQIGNAAGARDAQKWGSANSHAGGVYLNEITLMKTWLQRRLNWLDTRMPSRPTITQTSDVVAPGTQVTLGTGTGIYYTVDGSDPRPVGGGAPTTALLYTGPITITETTILTVRRLVSPTSVFPNALPTRWSAPERRVLLVNESFAAEGDLTISEINYNPFPPTAAESAALPGVSADDFEFIEIQNVSGQTVNLFEARFAEGSPFAETKLEPLSLAPGAFALVVRNRAAFALRHGTGFNSRIVGEWSEGSLSNNGERIQLLGRDGSTILDFTYDDGGDWPGRADGKGASLEYTGVVYTKSALENGNNWRSSGEFHGSPGVAGTGLDNRIVINEIFANSPSPRVDAIELFNPGAVAVDISGWYLSDEGGPETIDSFRQFQIPQGTVLQPGEYRVYTEAEFNPNGAWNPNAGPRGPGEFALDAANGDDVWLIESDANGVPIKVVDYQSIGATRLDESWGRWPNGTGRLVPLAERSLFDESVGTLPQPGLGARNSDPRIGPLLISEIQHSHPTNPAFEFVEFRNPTDAAQSLTDWRVRGAIDFDFAPNATIPAGGLIVLVPFSPDDTVQASAFRTAYGIGENVTLVGPWSAGDTLSGSGRVTLQRALPPQPEEPGVIPRDVEDEANYRSNAAWPQATGGLSLNRVYLIHGDLPEAWRADIPTPGDTVVTYAMWKALFFPGGGEGSADGDDPDFDGITNFGEYSWGTPPLGFNLHAPGNPSLSITEGELVFTFEKPLNRPDAQYQAQISEDLETWTPVTDTAVSIGLDTEIRQFTMPFSNDPPRLFFRVYPAPTPAP